MVTEILWGKYELQAGVKRVYLLVSVNAGTDPVVEC